MNFIEYPDRELMMAELAMLIAGELTDMFTHQERATLAVCGGTTPAPVFDTLSAVDLHWDRVDVLLTDERWVPEDDPRSNAALVRKHLLQDKAAAARFHPFYRAGETAEEAAGALAEEVAALAPLSIVLLGMGEDMHTASLFPGGDNLEAALAADAPAVMAMRAEAAGEPRVTLTAPAINGAMSKHLVITGTAKRAALARAEDLPPSRAPVRAVMPELQVHWAP